MGGSENSKWLIGVARDRTQPIEIRKQALFWAGQGGAPLADLASLYNTLGGVMWQRGDLDGASRSVAQSLALYQQVGYSWGMATAYTNLGILAYTVKSLFFCWLQIMTRWTLPRFRYDQLMKLGWIGLLPLGFLNAIVTAAVILALGSH